MTGIVAADVVKVVNDEERDDIGGGFKTIHDEVDATFGLLACFIGDIDNDDAAADAISDCDATLIDAFSFAKPAKEVVIV